MKKKKERKEKNSRLFSTAPDPPPPFAPPASGGPHGPTLWHAEAHSKSNIHQLLQSERGTTFVRAQTVVHLVCKSEASPLHGTFQSAFSLPATLLGDVPQLWRAA